MGRAYLFDKVVNVDLGEADDRHMRTGKHTVRDVACSRCKSYLGWKYVRVVCAGYGADTVGSRLCLGGKVQRRQVYTRNYAAGRCGVGRRWVPGDTPSTVCAQPIECASLDTPGLH